MHVLVTCDGDGQPVAYGRPDATIPAETGGQPAVLVSLVPPGTHEPGTITRMPDELVDHLREANLAMAEDNPVILVMVTDGGTMLAVGPFDGLEGAGIEARRQDAAASGITVIPVSLRLPPATG